MKARCVLGNGDTLGGVTNLWSSAYDHLRQFTAASRWTNGVIAHRKAGSYDKAGHRASEQAAAAAAGDRPSVIQRNTYLVGGGGRVAGFLSQKGSVSIAGTKARMHTADYFEGEVIAHRERHPEHLRCYPPERQGAAPPVLLDGQRQGTTRKTPRNKFKHCRNTLITVGPLYILSAFAYAYSTTEPRTCFRL